MRFEPAQRVQANESPQYVATGERDTLYSLKSTALAHREKTMEPVHLLICVIWQCIGHCKEALALGSYDHFDNENLY